MNPVIIPESYNYIGVFLTFACNLKCSFCINNFEQSTLRRKIISGKDWVENLNRIISRRNLPVTLQGGEPSLHPDFFYIINNLKSGLNIDILTNLQFNVEEFIKKVNPDRIKRNAPYASIRVSYHPKQMNLEDIIKKTLIMLEANFSIGIWGVLYPPDEKIIRLAQKKCQKLGIDFRLKEFLGYYDRTLYGTYKYPGACAKEFKKKVQCKTTEFLIDSYGDIFRCHRDLYANMDKLGNIGSPDFQIEDKFRDCDHFGRCNPCDIKIKTNRFQQHGHTSVEIKTSP